MYYWKRNGQRVKSSIVAKLKRKRNLPCYEPCIICGERAENHHIKSFGSGGPTLPHNLAPLCRRHHNEAETIGRQTFIKKHKLENYMRSKGWEYCEVSSKWFHPDNM